MSRKVGGKASHPDGMRVNELLFAKPVAVFLADWRTDSLISCKCCVIARSTASHHVFAGQRKYQDAGVTAFLGRNMVETHIAHAINGRFQVLMVSHAS